MVKIALYRKTFSAGSRDGAVFDVKCRVFSEKAIARMNDRNEA
jgi:hypothetical protein